MRLALTALSLVLMAFPANAASLGAARDLLVTGDYAAAQSLALAAQTDEGRLLAAEIKAARIMLIDTPDAKETAKDALRLVEKVLADEPDHTEALFLRALHQGFRTRSSSRLSIVLGGMIGDTRDAIEDFAQAAPGDPRADALLGAWHLGIVRAAGDGKFGASLAEGMAAYDRAVAAMPQDMTVLSNYAFSLIVMDDPAVRPRAGELLDRIETLPVNDAFGRETRARMMRLKAVIDQPDALRRAAGELLNTDEG